jgi:hypothetical protein
MQINKVKSLDGSKDSRLHGEVVQEAAYVSDDNKADIIGIKASVDCEVVYHHPTQHAL